ncbi:MAG TPA: AtpZ/AtpI family protein [Firmicutes bacterium]|nr:AtpZ/AtpI family protein [Bacillota bacterium]
MHKDYYDYSRFGGMGISFVLVASLYIFLGYKGGEWLDARLGSYPWLTVVGLMAAAVLSLRFLIRMVLEADEWLRESASTRKARKDHKKTDDEDKDGRRSGEEK